MQAVRGTVPIEVLVEGDYTVTAEIDPDAEDGPDAFAEGASASWPFVFTHDDLCEVGQETFTDASIGFIDLACERGQQLDPAQLVAVTTAADARFVEPLTPPLGRTVSSDTTVLTFTSQLLGPDLTGDCLPTLPLTEGSVTFTPATCLDATNGVVLPSTEGVQWWVDGEAMAEGSWPMSAGEVVVEATPLRGYGFAAVLITLAGFGAVIGRRSPSVRPVRRGTMSP